MDETMNTAVESTTSEVPETNQEPNTETEVVAAPQEQTEVGTGTASDGASAGAITENQEEPYMIARFNHEDKPLTREEATTWVQLGMKHQALYDRLDYIAAQSDTSVEALIDGMLDSMENAKRTELEERFGDDKETIKDLMTLYRNGQKEKYEKVKEGRKEQEEKTVQSTNARIASEFTEMKKDFPELQDYASLPESVRRAAVDGMPLAYAYLKHMHNENQKISKANETAAEAAKKSVGSMNSEEAETSSETDRRFLASLWGN